MGISYDLLLSFDITLVDCIEADICLDNVFLKLFEFAPLQIYHHADFLLQIRNFGSDFILNFFGCRVNQILEYR